VAACTLAPAVVTAARSMPTSSTRHATPTNNLRRIDAPLVIELLAMAALRQTPVRNRTTVPRLDTHVKPPRRWSGWLVVQRRSKWARADEEAHVDLGI